MDGGPLVASVELLGPSDSDAQELDELTRSLRDELLAAGVDDARPVTTGSAPTGSKAGEAIQLGALAVAMAPAALQGAIDTVRAWGARRPVRKVTITIANDSLTLDAATAAEQGQLVKAFLDRHGDVGT